MAPQTAPDVHGANDALLASSTLWRCLLKRREH